MNPKPHCHGDHQEGVAEYTLMTKEPIPFNENGVIYYHLANSTKDMNKVDHRSMLHKVFDEMNYQLYPMRAIETDDINKAYFKIYFVDENLNCLDDQGKVMLKCPYRFKLDTLAVQYAYYGTRLRDGSYKAGKWAGHCFVNDRFFYQLEDSDSGQAKSIVNILIHEVVGHGTGIGHTDVEGDIMGPFYDKDNTFGPDSCAAIHEVYTPLKLKFLAKKDATKNWFLPLVSASPDKEESKPVVSKPVEKKRKRRFIGLLVDALLN